MSGMLDSQEIGIPCKNCGRSTKKTVGWINSNRQFTCSCGTTINIDASQFRGQIAELEKALSKFKGMFK